MKRNNIWKRVLSVFLTGILLFSLCPTAFAAERTISIGTAAELKSFAKRCASDTYSTGLTVQLSADIDVKNMEISIPIFLGTFDGQGHSIVGLHLEESASLYGLFSRVESGAVIKNLSVSGKVMPAGTQNKVGGIAGENYGRIENCTFSGLVIGGSNVGGIAGYNGGTISECSTAGVVRGTTYTGGIVGHHAGTLLRCTNRAAVNTTVSESDRNEEELDNLENTLYSILKREEVTETAVTTDTGGIAGFSSGIMQSCTNLGAVGYPHVGYNVGGIVGRQNGYLASCTNQGGIQGRKDVGGIVGQMTPDITLQSSSGSLDDLRNDLNTLQSLIDRTLDDAQAASDTISNRIERISDYADTATDHAYAMSNQLTDFAEETIDTANDLFLLVERYLTKLEPIMDDLEDASGSLEKSLRKLRKLINDMDDNLEYDQKMLKQLREFSKEMNQACEELLSALDAWKEVFSQAGGSAVPDMEKLRTEIQTLKKANTKLETTLKIALQEWEQGGAVSEETKTQIKAALSSVLQSYEAVAKELVQVLKNTDFDALRNLSPETLQKVLAALRETTGAFSSATEHMKAALEALYKALKGMTDFNDRLEDAVGQINTAMKAAEKAVDSFGDAFSKMGKWAKNLAEEEIPKFSSVDPAFEENNSGLNSALNGISNELSALNGELSASSTTLLSDAREINSQFMKVMNQFLDLLDDVQNVEYEDIFEDVSEESLQSATRGKVLECINYGTVEADRNAGGIAGAMAIEYDLDPEDDLHSSENRSFRFSYQTKAILLDCDNYGIVEAKKSCAGGIAGRMDIGTISGCGGWGDVFSENGDYVGGVAGLSLSSIRDSYAKCMLQGEKYIGGIVGSGSRVSGCRSMVDIAEYIQYGGAIAGEMTGAYSGNYFVAEELAGVDRVSLSGKAEEVSYQTLCGMENIPENFEQLSLRFVAEDKVVKKVDFDYGTSFGAEIYPEVPEKEGHYVSWDKTDLENLCYDTLVTAEYEPYVTTLATEAKRDDHPILLVEGNFGKDDHLQAVQEETNAPISGRVLETWTVQIPDDGAETHFVRWRIPADNRGSLHVYEKGEKGWKETETEVIGSYLCFELSGEGQFAVSSRIPTAWLFLLIAIVCIVVVLVFILHRKQKMPGIPILHRKKKKEQE